MNNTAKKAYFVMLLTAGVCALTATVLRMILMLNYFDGYYYTSSAVSIAANTFTVLGCLCAPIALFLPSKQRLHPVYSGTPSIFAATFLSFVLAAYGVFGIFTLFSSSFVTSPDTAITLLTVILSLVGIGYFAFNASLKRQMTTVKLIFGLAIPVMCMLTAFAGYLSSRGTDTMMNGPVILLDIATFIFIAFYFLSEIGLLLRRNTWKITAASGVAAFVLAAVNTFPNLIYCLAKGEQLFPNTMHDFLVFAFFLYIIIRILALVNFPLNHVYLTETLFPEQEEIADEAEEKNYSEELTERTAEATADETAEKAVEQQEQNATASVATSLGEQAPVQAEAASAESVEESSADAATEEAAEQAEAQGAFSNESSETEADA